MGDGRNRYCLLKNTKLTIYKKEKEKKKELLLASGRFFIFLRRLIPFKLTGTIPNGFFLISMSSTPVSLRVGVGFIGKELIDSFRVDGLGWSLGLDVNGDVGKVQVRERSFDLMEAIVKAVSKGATKLL